MWHYRRLLWDLVKQDFAGRYAGSVLGVFWNIAQPAAQVFIFAVILAKIIGSRLPAGVLETVQADPFALSIYICAGLLPWIVLSETLARNATTFLAHSNLIKKVAFPHPLLVLYQVFSGLGTLAIMLALFIVVILVTGHGVGWSMVWLPALFAVQAVFTFGLGLMLATLTAHFRDVPQFVTIVLQLWFWMTPIVYFRQQLETLFPFARLLVKANPLFHLTNLYQNILFLQTVGYDTLPNTLVPVTDRFLLKFGVMGVLAVAVALAAVVFYDKLRAELPDQI